MVGVVDINGELVGGVVGRDVGVVVVGMGEGAGVGDIENAGGRAGDGVGVGEGVGVVLGFSVKNAVIMSRPLTFATVEAAFGLSKVMKPFFVVHCENE